MIRDFYGWWTTQLAECIPSRWRETARARQDALAISPIGPLGTDVGAISASVWSKNQETPLGQFKLRAGGLSGLTNPAHLPVVLHLLDTDVLSKTVTLPLATERELAQVLGFEMDRETPFSADEICWNYRVIRRDKERGQIIVRLRLIPRATLAPLLDELAAAGITARQAEIVGGPDDGMTIFFDADIGQPAKTSVAHVARWAAAALCVALCLGAIAAPFIRQARDLNALDQRLASGRAASAQAEQLRRDIDRLAGAGDAMDKERASAGNPLATLAALTNALPDDTYLTELQLQQRKVTLAGRSASASRLIGALAGTAQLRNPAFTAPVTRMEAAHTDVFTITAEVAP